MLVDKINLSNTSIKKTKIHFCLIKTFLIFYSLSSLLFKWIDYFSVVISVFVSQASVVCFQNRFYVWKSSYEIYSIERKLTKENYFFIENIFFQIKFLQKFDIKHVVESKYCFRQEFLAKNVNLICQKNNNNVYSDLFQARMHFTYITLEHHFIGTCH